MKRPKRLSMKRLSMKRLSMMRLSMMRLSMTRLSMLRSRWLLLSCLLLGRWRLVRPYEARDVKYNEDAVAYNRANDGHQPQRHARLMLRRSEGPILVGAAVVDELGFGEHQDADDDNIERHGTQNLVF
jgi:hypothetical protein